MKKDDRFISSQRSTWRDYYDRSGGTFGKTMEWDFHSRSAEFPGHGIFDTLVTSRLLFLFFFY